MKKYYNPFSIFFYKESTILFSSSRLGSCKLRYLQNLNCICYISKFFFIFFPTFLKTYFSKKISYIVNFISILFTSSFYGYRLKFGHRGKRVRIFYNRTLFFLKLGYSRRVPFLLPLCVSSFAKEKKIRFYTLSSINFNSLSKTAFHISSFRMVDPYNFGGIMLRDGYFKYTRWIRKNNI